MTRYMGYFEDIFGPTTYGTHRASQECLIDRIKTRYEILEGHVIDPTICGTQSGFQECLNRMENDLIYEIL